MGATKIILYSYKNKRLQEIIDNIYETSELKNFSIKVFDQSTVRRHHVFKGYENLEYEHVFWDSLESPCKRKSDEVVNSESAYVAIVSDDVWFNQGWDTRLTEFLKDKEVVVSGRETANLSYKDMYTIKNVPAPSEDFRLSQYIDRNFVFARTEVLKSVKYPSRLKYYGEEEILSINVLDSEVDIFNAPSNLYLDLGVRTVENLYTTFSKYHNFNNVHRAIQSGRAKNFLEYHNLDKDCYFPAPDLINDVEYDVHENNFFTSSGKKFVEKVNVLNPAESVVE